jgi:ABC-type transport system involved in multi-copper enzyme maturation permease subunit
MSCVVWGVFGMALGMITRSSAIAIAAGAGYFLLGERLLLNSLWPSTEEWLPAGVLSALAEGGNPAIGYGTAIVLAAAYGLGAFLLAATAFARRDITA